MVKQEFASKGSEDGLGLDYIFHPSSIAVVGASSIPFAGGNMLMQPLLSCGFKGNIYPVNPNETEVMGFKCYPNVKDIPGPVDYVIVCIPSRYTPKLIDDCVTKGVKVTSFFTAGFSETHEEEGIRLQTEIVDIARRGGMRLLGPNCMGIYNPSSAVSFNLMFPSQSGPLGLVCQSGANSAYTVSAAAARGIYLSKAVSYGNACDINETELLEYFAADPQTEIIAAYIEGIKDGPGFFKALKEATQSKPVIVLKGGYTEAGAATAASHTGSLACPSEVWDTLLRQAGAIQVYSIEELVDTTLPFLHMRPMNSRNVAILGTGGGASVISADHCSAAGFNLPPLTEEIKLRLEELATAAGNIYTNPVDTQALFNGPQAFADSIKILADWDAVDMLILRVSHNSLRLFPTEQVRIMIQCAEATNKPIAIVLDNVSSLQGWQAVFEEQRLCAEAGVPVFSSVKKAASAIDKFLRYQQR